MKGLAFLQTVYTCQKRSVHGVRKTRSQSMSTRTECLTTSAVSRPIECTQASSPPQLSLQALIRPLPIRVMDEDTIIISRSRTITALVSAVTTTTTTVMTTATVAERCRCGTNHIKAAAVAAAAATCLHRSSRIIKQWPENPGRCGGGGGAAVAGERDRGWGGESS